MSLRARLLIGVGVVAIVLGAAAVVVTRITQAHLLHRIDQQLEATAQRGKQGPAADVVLQQGSTIIPEGPVSTAAPPDEAEPGDSDGRGRVPTGADILSGLSGIWVATVTDDNVQFLVAAGASAPLDGEAGAGGEPVPPDDVGPTPAVDPDQVRQAAASGESFTVGAVDSDDRFRARAVAVEDSGQLLVYLQPLADVDLTVDRLIVVETLGTLAVLAVLALVAWWVLRHGIRPLQRMTATASAIAGGDLSHRVDRMAPGTEAHQLGVALNQMLGRIEQAFDERSHSERRLRQFVGDASHELRTPITTIRGYSELFETGGLDEPAELAEAMRRTRQEAVRMGNLVDDMLLLARLDQGRPLERAEVDVAALARDAGSDARAVDRHRDVVTSAEGPLMVQGDADRLRQVVANLVGNALVHTPPSAELGITARREGAWAVVEITDRGDGMPPEVVRQAFDRFYRADPARSRHRGGSGLGLSIVQATVLAHGGRVDLSSAPGQGTTVRVLLPLVAPETTGAGDEATASDAGSRQLHS